MEDHAMPAIEIAAFASFFLLVAAWLAAPTAETGAAAPAVSLSAAVGEA